MRAGKLALFGDRCTLAFALHLCHLDAQSVWSE